MKIVALLLLLLSFSSIAAPSYSEQVDCRFKPLACNIYMEARGEPLLGQLAVAFTTINRLQSGAFQSTLSKVVFEPKAFSWTKSGHVITVREKDQWDAARIIAKFVYRLSIESPRLYREMDPTKNSMFYHATYARPDWRANRYMTAKIGNHIFYERDSSGWPSSD